MIDISYRQFVDRDTVIDKVGKAEAKILSSVGALTRTVARRSIRPRKGTAAAGSPPSSHVGLLRDLIFFGLDPDKLTVVIGPKLLKSRSSPTTQLLEFGGSTTITNRKTGETIPVVYRKFAYMAPAHAIVSEKYPELFSDVVGG